MANTYLSRTFGAGGSPGTLTWTISTWFKRSNLTGEHVFMSSYINSGKYVVLKINGNNKFEFRVYNSADQWRYTTTMKFMDTSAWYHLTISFDSTQSTASERVIIYINGERITAFDASTTDGQNTNGDFNEAKLHTIGARNSTDYFNGYMSDFNFIDGTRYAATDFGETDTTTGEWRIKDLATLTYGTNGFRILQNGNTITDQSANSNNWTSSGAGVTPTEDCPSDVFCTFNPLMVNHNSVLTTSNGNTTATSNASAWQGIGGTLAVPPKTGKWYWEYGKFVGTQIFAGLVAGNTTAVDGTTLAHAGLGSITYFQSGRKTVDNVGTESYFTAFSDSNGTDVVGVALDMTAGTYGEVQFYLNGSTTGAAVALTSNFADQFVMPFVALNASPRSVSINTGNGYFGTTAVSSAGTNASGIGIFEHDVPTGYTALSTKGLNL